MMLSDSNKQQRTWVTYVSRESYIPGCLVLWSSLKRHSTKYPLLVLLPTCPGSSDVLKPTSDHAPNRDGEAFGNYSNCMISQPLQKLLLDAGCQIKIVDYLYPGTDGPHQKKSLNAAMDDRFKDTWTKFQAFGLFEYERVVLLDADMLVRDNMDELFEVPLPSGHIAACHACTCNPSQCRDYPEDWSPENCGHSQPSTDDPDAIVESWQPTESSPRTHHLLNSGLVLLEPSPLLFETVLEFLATDDRVKSFRFPDQDLLAIVFRLKVVFLRYKYNALKTLSVVHVPKWSDSELKNLHYIFSEKPWSRRSQFEWVEKSLESPISDTFSSDVVTLRDEGQTESLISKTKGPVSDAELFQLQCASAFYSLDVWWWQEFYYMKQGDRRLALSQWTLIENCLSPKS